MKNAAELLSAPDSEEESIQEDEELHFQLSSSVQMVSAGSIIVVRANDDYSSYYLIKVITPPFTLEEDTKDSYELNWIELLCWVRELSA